MIRVKAITDNKKYNYYMDIIKKYEMDRIFCKHGMEHLLDTARIVYILCLEGNIDVKKDVVYAAALLHDIGRALEYSENISHDVAGVSIAKEVLDECEYNDDEIELILNAISGHRGDIDKEYDKGFSDALKRGDKLSRNCLYCKAKFDCKWPDEKKNLQITY